jgi:hypothetical protein
MALDLLMVGVGGVIVDGTGKPAYPVDIGIEGDCRERGSRRGGGRPAVSYHDLP